MRKEFRSFEEAREFARDLFLRSRSEWKKLAMNKQLPKDIPHDPAKSYNKEWDGWKDWLEYEKPKNYREKYLSYDEASDYVQKLHLQNRHDWDNYYQSGKKPIEIPATPWRVYKNKGWIGLWHWLGIKKPRTFGSKYLSYEQAKEIVKKFNLTGKDKWVKFIKLKKLPPTIPSTPERYYKNKGWKGWGDWLGTGRIANQNKKYWSFEKSRLFIQNLNLKNRDEFIKLIQDSQIPISIPRAPGSIYKKTGEWISWGDFLGTGWIHPIEKSKNRPNFEESRKEARELAKKYNLKSWDDWINAVKEGKIPYYLPQRPDKIFNKKK